ncbi:MAG: cbb3-type cytochrome c oxidase subunit I [Deltaproteobacteria bacterium]|nr:cbb3-type cytochrome c oxidase subunit I [Deltaproteobacteria bacterium]MBW2418966.1 cbb3-type cytochrome c oxidase subunit I [Deltaproteobacteria bacterium]
MPADTQTTAQGLTEARCARYWLGLAIGVLMLAGLFSLVVVIGRMPPFDRWVDDPLFFKRGLVVHVNLALVAWFYSFIAALLYLLPGRRAPGWIAQLSPHISAVGVVMLLLAAGLPGSQPVLSNYVPMIDHWLFGAGQVVFALGIIASFMGRRLLPTRAPRPAFFPLPAAAQIGARATALGLLLAAVTFAISWWRTSPELSTEVYYELLVWGGGHVLQLTCSVAMVTVWLALLSSVFGREPISRNGAALLYFAMMAPWIFSPFLAMQGTSSGAYRTGFTDLMRWSIFPVVSIFLFFCIRELLRQRREANLGLSSLADPRISGFLVSAALTVLGFGLGAAIRGSNTMVPAHYHASIGAVTAAFMTFSYLMLGAFGLAPTTPRMKRAAAWQPVVYGVGQMVFASGFALAGAYGMSRKAYGAEQAARGLGESIGLAVMGIGGFIAVVGGILFLVVVAVVWQRRAEDAPRPITSVTTGSRRYRWAKEIRTVSTRSRS